MHEKRSWSTDHPAALRSALARKCNLRLCVDGGRRLQTEGALGMALYSAELVHPGTYKYVLLARRGCLLKEVASAFLAETMALDWSLEFLYGLLRTGVT